MKSTLSLPRYAAILCLLCLLAAVRPCSADEVRHPSKLFSESSLAYFELSQPEKLLDAATQPRLWDVLKQNENVEQFFASDQFKQLRAAVELVESRIGLKWEPALRDLIGGGIYVAFDPAAGGGAVVIKPRKAETLTKLHDTLKELIEADARNNRRESPIKSQEYQGHTGWSFGPGESHVMIGDVLAISNQSDVLKAMVDRHRAGQMGGEAKRSLADAADFQQAHKSLPADRAGWGFVKLGMARLIPGVTKALEGPSDNPVVELLGAGVMEALKTAPYAAFSLHGDSRKIRFRVQLPFDHAKTAVKRKWYFAAQPEKAAYAALKPKGTIQSISIYRDLSGMWLQREKLFNDEVIAGLAQADSGLGLYFSGRDFGTEVLGALTPRMQFVVARQQFAADEPLPAIKLPAFALVLEMKKPDDFAKHLLLGYQKVIGLANVVGGMNGQPQLLLDSEEHQGVKIWRGKYLVEPNIDKQKAPIHFNFSPACATVGNRFVISSTLALTRDLIDELKKPSAAQLTSDNVAIITDLTEVATILGDNQDALVARGMLQDGGTRAQSTARFKLLLEGLRATRTSSLRLGASSDHIWLETIGGVPQYGERK